MTGPHPPTASSGKGLGHPWRGGAAGVLALGSALYLYLLFACLSGNAHLMGEKPGEVWLICVAAAGVPPLAVAYAGLRQVSTARGFGRGMAVCLAAVAAHVPFTVYAAHSHRGLALAAGELVAGAALALLIARSQAHRRPR